MSLRLWLMLREGYVVSNVAAAGAHTITTPIQPSSSTGQGFHEQRAKKKTTTARLDPLACQVLLRSIHGLPPPPKRRRDGWCSERRPPPSQRNTPTGRQISQQSKRTSEQSATSHYRPDGVRSTVGLLFFTRFALALTPADDGQRNC